MSARPDEVAVLVFTGDSGLTHYSMALARDLAHHRPVTLVTARSYDGQGYPELPVPVRRAFRRTRHYPLDMIRLLVWLLRHRPAVVSVQSLLKYTWPDGLFFRLLSWCGIPAVLTVHDVLPHYPGPFSRLGHRWLYRSFGHLVVHSERAVQDIRALGVQTPCHVVPHGVYDIFDFDGETPAQARQRHSPFGPEDFVLLFFGSIDSRKGIAALVELIESSDDLPGVRFVIAGRQQIAAGDRALRARFEGLRQHPRCLVRDDGIPFGEVQRWFRMSDAVVLPYLEGTTSGVLKLAYAFGLPVIASRVGDLGEALDHDGTGLSLPAGFSVAQLRQAVLTLQARRAEFAGRGQAMRARYGWAGIARRYHAALGLAQRSGPGEPRA